ncbi:MAG TPA: hypothetical protein VGS79_26635 [Puia sp.]|nr:hypothetical protein [Puia sp.]
MSISTRSTTASQPPAAPGSPSSREPQAIPEPSSSREPQAIPEPSSLRGPQAAPASSSPREPVTRPSKWRAILPLPAGKALGVLLLAILTLLTAMVLIELPVLHHTQGNILFPLDNAYVNIAVGRDLAFYQVWGVSKYAFQSAASSLLYPLTLAPFFFILGAHLIIPLIVNFLAGVYFLLMLQRTLIRYGLPPARQFLVLIGAMGLTLLPLLVVSGMEYTLQLLFVFLFMDTLAQTLPAPVTTTAPAPTASATKAPAPPTLYIFGLLAVAARYEDLLVVALGCVLLGLQKSRRSAAKLAAIAVSPILIFGLISVIKKSSFLPNPMLVGPYLTYTTILALIATAAAAWLIIRNNTTIPLLLLLVPFTVRNASNLVHFEKDCDRTYDEQYLTAHFVHLYYFMQTVGTNQPGAVSYFSEGRKLDYTGVASNDVVRMTKEYGWTPLYADSLSKKDGIRVAIVADPWFRADQFPKWTRIATWDIADDDPPVAHEKAVNFYAVQPYDTAWLRKRLHEYQHLLPSTVSVKYY